ncbi:hypothetical protein FSB76_24160 [Mucilaginibacter ginsenosidivorax]|uniref:DUF5000 domain-containing protein n=2 Tax=Mucilaginibacter ginsenosidivorax TaxID=862126 RepID=A0A5B8WDQ9_9SPHI|nr:hypothetical protein FSB76_24160 [Mucilaginibacter ginsenosidivorax]
MIALSGCGKNNQQTDFKKYLGDHELVYTGAVGKVIVQPGNLEIGLKWKSSTDPSITKYIIYYNNKSDSAIININGPTDTVRAVIKGLSEYTYSFTIYSSDAKGNRSVPVEVNNAKVYGPIYASNLLNRGYDALNPYTLNDDGSLTLNFIAPDTINIKTVIKYTNAKGESAEAELLPKVNSITLPSYKLASPITYQSSFIPERGAIDVFTVSKFDSFPRIYSYVQCDKSLFKDDASLPNDVYADYGTSLSKLWDGSVGPQAYPNIFHTNDMQLPHTFTFDMGKIYDNLGRIEETGRSSDHNPVDFEVWGIADIANAATKLKSTDAGWSAEMASKGWTMLKECIRTDDGKQAVRFDITNNPVNVRYIRIRVIKTIDNSNLSNWSELTFWNKQ